MRASNCWVQSNVADAGRQAAAVGFSTRFTGGYTRMLNPAVVFPVRDPGGQNGSAGMRGLSGIRVALRTFP